MKEKVKNILKKYPFTTYGLVILMLFFLLSLIGKGSEYDDGGLGTAIFLFGLIMAILAFPYHIANECLFSLNEGVYFDAMAYLTPIIGLLFFMFLDFLLFLFRCYRRRKEVAS